MLFNWSHKKPINPSPACSLPLSLSLSLSNHNERELAISSAQCYFEIYFFKFNLELFLQHVFEKHTSKKVQATKGEDLHAIALFSPARSLNVGIFFSPPQQYMCSQENSNSGLQYWICQAQAI